MGELFLPVLSHFQNGNTFFSSDGRLRYKVVPGEDILHAESWEGPWCRELSAVEARGDFPLTDDGLEALRTWVAEQSAAVNARPERSLAENLERRRAAADGPEGGAQ